MLKHTLSLKGLLALISCGLQFLPQILLAQNVGIGTTEPQAALHVADSSVVFTATPVLTNAPAAPVSGPGARFMWYAPKAALRAGNVSGTQWNAANVGMYSFATGHNVIASADASAAFGLGSTASGTGAVAMGNASTASGIVSFALGNNASALAHSSVALGYMSTASGSYSVGVGSNSNAGAMHALALGMSADARTLGQVSVGAYNQIILGDMNAWVPSDPLFVIGNGTNSAQRSTALTVLKNGNVGIGVLSPQARLQVNGQMIVGTGAPLATFHVDGNQIIRRNSSTGNAHLILEETGLTDGGRLQIRNSTISGKFWEIYGLPHATNSADAYFNIYYETVGNAMALRGNGNVSFRGSVSQNSDVRLKKDIEPLNNPLEKLLHLNGYRYHWKQEQMDSNWQAGLLAQEVEKVLPELVSTGEDGMKSVNYSGLIPYLLESIKDLKKQVDELKNK